MRRGSCNTFGVGAGLFGRFLPSGSFRGNRRDFQPGIGQGIEGGEIKKGLILPQDIHCREFYISKVFINEIERMTGIPAEELTNERLVNPDSREELFEEAEARMLAGEGELGLAYLAIEQAAIDADLVQEQVRQIPVQIHDIESTANEINKINLEREEDTDYNRLMLDLNFKFN